MRRITVFISDKEFRDLSKRAEKLKLEPHELINLRVAKFLGVQIPEKKSEWKDFLEDRALAQRIEGYKADELGKGTRRVDELVQAWGDRETVTVSELAELLGVSRQKVVTTLRNYPEHFEQANPNKGKFETAIWRMIGSSSRRV